MVLLWTTMETCQEPKNKHAKSLFTKFHRVALHIIKYPTQDLKTPFVTHLLLEKSSQNLVHIVVAPFLHQHYLHQARLTLFVTHFCGNALLGFGRWIKF